jgi:hypothetical protein
MTTELPDGNLPDDAAQDQVGPSLIQPGEVGDTALEMYHEKLVPKGSIPMTADEINRETIKRFKGYKYGKYALKAKTAQLRLEPVRIERNRGSGHR